jgi:subtilisin-like proprotein convertase family protein
MRKIRLGIVLAAVAGVIGLVPGAANAATFSNPAPITINDFTLTDACSPTGPDGAQATPYPSPVVVSGLPTQTTDVNATISGFTHGFPSDVRILLVSPQGQGTELFHEAGGSTSVSNVDLTFDDAAADTVPDPIVSGTYKPTQVLGSCLPPNIDYPPPAPANPYGMDLAGFNGADPNGTWNLYVVDDTHVDSGSIDNGWSLEITATAPPVTPTTSVTPTTPTMTENARCARLRKKLERQKHHLAKAGTDKKRSKILENIAGTKRRLSRLDC